MKCYDSDQETLSEQSLEIINSAASFRRTSGPEGRQRTSSGISLCRDDDIPSHIAFDRRHRNRRPE